MPLDQRLGLGLIAAAAAAVLLLGAWRLGAAAGRPGPLPQPHAVKHGVAFRLHAHG